MEVGAAEQVAPALPADAFSQGDVLQGTYTVEQFLAWMRIRPERFELHGDRIVCMSGTAMKPRPLFSDGNSLASAAPKRLSAACAAAGDVPAFSRATMVQTRAARSVNHSARLPRSS